MFQITKRFEFDAAHRLYQYEGLCANLHGHHYIAEVTVEATELNQQGMVVDFGQLNKLIGGWINCNWDHATLLNKEGPDDLAGRIFRMSQPTAENMAKLLHQVAVELLHHLPVKVVRVRMYETPDSWADYDEPTKA
jgi:6-pyruvoyltetrahydropterin/6-carboxytetrahydropterin synthase